MNIASEDLIRIGLSLACGALLGFEREYRNKSAGFRTLILITLGSTIFTMVSQRFGEDRIAANIITGIGFIGAGVIFKDNYSVTGLTTAAVIWIAAAIGMVIGVADFDLGMLLAAIVLVILSLFHGLENLLDWVHHRKTLSITLAGTNEQVLQVVESHLKKAHLKFVRKELSKTDQQLKVTMLVFGRKNRIKALDAYLVASKEIIHFNFAQTSR